MPLFPRRTVLAHSLAVAATLTAFNSFSAPVQAGELVYVEQQAHTNLYPPAGGFYPNGGILHQITDKLTWQNRLLSGMKIPCWLNITSNASAISP